MSVSPLFPSRKAFVFSERWKSPKNLAAHFEEDHLKKLVAAIPKMLDGVPKFAFYKLAE